MIQARCMLSTPKFRAERPRRDRRAVVPVRLAVPADSVEVGIDECDGNGTGRPLAHPAMTEIGLVRLDLRLESNGPAGAAALHHFHGSTSRDGRASAASSAATARRG